MGRKSIVCTVLVTWLIGFVIGAAFVRGHQELPSTSPSATPEPRQLCGPVLLKQHHQEWWSLELENGVVIGLPESVWETVEVGDYWEPLGEE